MAMRQKKPAAFTVQNTRSRLLCLGWLFTLLFGGVLGRLLYLQTVRAQELRLASARYGGLREHRWTVYGTRGFIKDRQGNVLAMDVTSLSIYIRPKAVTEPARVAQTLAPVVGVPSAAIENRIREGQKANVRTAFFLKRELVGEKAARLRECVAREKERLKQEARRSAKAGTSLTSWLDGVDIVEEPRRWYPYGSIASTLIGFTDRDERGLSGVEWLYNEMLSASRADVKGVVGANGQILAGTRVVRGEARNGRDVQLTIDVNIQSIAEECLQEVIQKHHPAGACAVVMDARNGDLLAVANAPHIDLNRREKELQERGLGVMRNMAGMFLFEPGSTFKPITVAAAMEAGIVRDGSLFYCTGSKKIGKHTIHCAWHGGSRAHGRQKLKEVVAHSCNIATAMMGLKLGPRALYDAVQRFGFLRAPVAGSLAGRLSPPDRWQAVRTANVAFGQGIQVTPIGLAAAYAVIANGGNYVKPRLLLSEPMETHPVLSPEVASKLREYLEAVVDEGTGKLAVVHGYKVAGKTGTAQKAIPGRRGYALGKYVSSFVGFAPADDPRIVVLVVVDEPHNGYFGGVVAAPAFARITERVLAYLGIPAQPDEEERVAHLSTQR
ncbi:MAG: hypothetical protein C4335_10720 [Armatimonadota bacterium]